MLNNIWFILWGVLWAVYFMLDGFDLGTCGLMPFVAKDDRERRVVLNSVGPYWDGNEVWLITAGGVTFAAFPRAYAVMFSSLYSALLLVLFALILRGVSLEFRGQLESPGWKRMCDTILAVVSIAAAVLFGVAFANIFQGIPIDAGGVYHGSLLTLLNPYGLLGGVLFLLLFLVHGALWLTVKAEGPVAERAARAATKLWPALVACAIVFLGATYFATGLWGNYLKAPLLLVIPLLAVAGLLLTRFYIAKRAWLKSWFSSALTIVSATLFGVAGLYPNLLPSNLDQAASLTIYNSSSSPLTLKIMLGVALVFVPVVIVYQVLVYRFFGYKVTDEELAYDEHY